MKREKFLLVCIVPLLTVSNLHSFIRGRSFFSPRSQSVHAERELVGFEEDINLYCAGTYGSFSLMPIYSKSTRSNELARYFFGETCFQIQGSQVPDRSEDALLADYFALPLDFRSTISLAPIISNIILDCNLYVGLDDWYPGLYVRFHAPFVSTTWNVRLKECVEEFGTTSYPAGYMASGEVSRSEMPKSFSEWINGYPNNVGDIVPLKFGKINGPINHTGLSEVQVAFGWNFINAPDYHFGLNLRGSIPTGNRSISCYFFEPIVGNGGHWEFGLGFTGHGQMWESCDGEKNFLVYGDLNITHLFGALEKRSFDLRFNGPASRYILLEAIGNPIVQGLMVEDTPALQQYHGEIVPAINKTTLDANVSIAMQVDMALKFVYMHCNYTFEFGYDFWARTAESISSRECFPSNSYAVKGDAQVYGFNRVNQRFVGLNATQSVATMFGGQAGGNANFLNSNADNSVDDGGNAVITTFEFAPGNDELTLNPPVPSDMRGSDQAILLTDCDIDTLSAAAMAAYSHTLFVHGRYTSTCCGSLVPYIGIGGEVTVDGSGSTRHSALSEWALWIKGGFAF